MLTIRGLSKTFGGRPGSPSAVALDHVNLDVAEGDFATVLGPSGCGKTTLLRMIAGFETSETGSIEIDAKNMGFGPGRVSPHHRGVGIVPQDGALFPHLSVAQNVGFGLTGRRSTKMKRVAEVLKLVGLSGLASRRPHELSGGQQQRIALARAMAPEPKLILLDEPFSALDAHLRESLRTEVHGLLKSIGATVILVTHDQSEALTLADHLVVMRDGKVVQSGSPRETYFRPHDIELARFLGDAVVLSGDIAENSTTPAAVSCAFGQLDIGSWHGGCGGCEVLIRPENITILPNDSTGPSVEGAVTAQSFHGHDQVIFVAVPGLNEAVRVRVVGGLSYHIGQSVRLEVSHPVCTYSRLQPSLT